MWPLISTQRRLGAFTNLTRVLDIETFFIASRSYVERNLTNRVNHHLNSFLMLINCVHRNPMEKFILFLPHSPLKMVLFSVGLGKPAWTWKSKSRPSGKKVNENFS